MMGQDNFFYYIQNGFYMTESKPVCPHTRVINI